MTASDTGVVIPFRTQPGEIYCSALCQQAAAQLTVLAGLRRFAAANPPGTGLWAPSDQTGCGICLETWPQLAKRQPEADRTAAAQVWVSRNARPRPSRAAAPAPN